MLGRIISIALLIYMGITFPIFYVVAVLIWFVTYPFDRKLKILHYYTCFWGSMYIWVMPTWCVKTEGREKYRKNVPYIIVSNHPSRLDILVNFRLFLYYKIVSKSEIFRVPCIGWNMTLNQYIKLVRGDKDGVKNMMIDSEKAIRGGKPVFFYPEGTRSIDGEIKDFKPGAFILAKDAKAPILPIIINGTGNALPKWKMKTFGVHRIIARVLDEIPYEKFAELSVKETSEYGQELNDRGPRLAQAGYGKCVIIHALYEWNSTLFTGG
jgi:1-acyl-sn-glycerol-3-phosphate acyltransferase